jgi:carbon starvation protein CstA
VLWILIGCVFVGAFHDFAALFLSVRDKGRSIGHVIEGLMGYAGRQAFLVFAWATLVLVVAIFALLVAKTFVSTPAVATASLLFIGMAPVFGWLVYRKNVSILAGSLVFVPLLFLFVWVGTLIPLDLSSYLQKSARSHDISLTPAAMNKGLDRVVADLRKDEVVAARLQDSASPAAAMFQSAVDTVRKGLAALGDTSKEGMAAEDLKAAVLAPVGTVLGASGANQPQLADSLADSFVTGVIAFHADNRARAIWIWVLLAYVFVASVVPVWLLLQPRDYLNSYLLYAMILVGFFGVLIFAPGIKMPAFVGFVAKNHVGRPGMLFPILFVTVACGACSGFHSLVASGTTAKQLSAERDILPVGYGGMLVEGVLAIMALVSVAYLAPAGYDATLVDKGPVGAFASGLATFAEGGLKLPFAIGKTFIALAISAFMLTTLDTATRLARFTWQELFLPKATGEENEGARKTHVLANPVVATMASVGGAAALAFSGGGSAIWPVFGASNQLLAALTLLALTLYLLRAKKNYLLALVPMVFMMAITIWALVMLIKANLGANGNLALAATSAFLLVMALVLAGLAIASVRRVKSC